jgi:TAZ zinc finger
MCIVPPVCLSNTPYVDPLAVMPASLLPVANMTPAYISPIPVTFVPAIPNPEVTAPAEKKKRKRYPKKAASNLSIDATFSDKKQRAQRSPTAVHENMSVKQESLTFLDDDNLDNNMDYSLFDPSSDLYCYDAQFPSDMDSLCFDIIPEEHVIAAFPSNTMHQDSSSVSMRICTEEYISPKRRRRLNQIVPNPRKPWTVEYQCSLCSENYSMGVQENPWYTVCIHECPHCKMQQVPKFDINAPCNSIELDPNIIALYGEGVDDEDCVGEEDEVEDGNGEDQEEEDHPFGTEGSLEFEEASKLLVLMCHARTCTGVHTSAKHSEICKSTKFLMLHIRDCNGIDIYGNDCKFPWCTPCKRMLKHLTRCYEPTKCSICNPFTLPESYRQLQTINNLRVTS